MLQDFKKFAFKGNLVDMAVAFILGAGFATVVKSLVSNVILPPIGLLIGDVDFKSLKCVIKEGSAAVKEGDKVITPEIKEVAISYGQFIDDAVAFFLLAFVVFLIVKKFMAAFEKEKEAAPAPAPPKQEVLLEGILEELKKKG